VNHAFARHLVDERHRVPKGVLDLRGVVGVNRGADRAEGATQAAAQVAVRLAADDVLTMGLES
jgi:hypothetical protein